MGLLDQNQERNYFPDSEADIFLQEFQQPKQEMNIPEMPELEQEESAEPEKKGKTTRRAAKQTSKIVVGLIEGPTATFAEIISKGCDSKKYKFDDGERETLTEAFADYFEVKGADLPPGVLLLIAVLTIVGSKFGMAFKDRKENLRIAEAEKRAKDMEAELTSLREQLEEKTKVKTDE